MEAVIDTDINLFGQALPDFEDIKKLALFVNCSERNQIAFAAQAEDAGDDLAAGIAFCILGRTTEALKRLDKAGDCKEKFLFKAESLRKLNSFDQAIENLDKAKAAGADALYTSLEKADTLRQAGKLDEAENQLKAAGNAESSNAQYHYVLGRLQEAQGLYEQAMDNYRKAVEIDPKHHNALFHLAFSCDLRGDEEAAIDYYKQLIAEPPVHVSALLNLAVLYEDAGEYDKAEKCVQQVLANHPNHQRAILFSKDIESSKTMLYDEDYEKSRTIRNKILETPISDFELSVRSRNCLKKMNIFTLGDLLNITEVELLSYKNFGETSLSEIREILQQKGLELGMSVLDKAIDENEAATEVEANDDLLHKSINDLDLTVRSHKCIERLDINTVGELVSKTDAELLGCKNFGMTSLTEIKEVLVKMGLGLRQLD